MNSEEYRVAQLLLADPTMVYITQDGFRAYACAYGRLVMITGTNFNNLSRADALKYIDTVIRLHTMNWPETRRKAQHG